MFDNFIDLSKEIFRKRGRNICFLIECFLLNGERYFDKIF